MIIWQGLRFIVYDQALPQMRGENLMEWQMTNGLNLVLVRDVQSIHLEDTGCWD
jgi:hypothetical protein